MHLYSAKIGRFQADVTDNPPFLASRQAVKFAGCCKDLISAAIQPVKFQRTPKQYLSNECRHAVGLARHQNKMQLESPSGSVSRVTPLWPPPSVAHDGLGTLVVLNAPEVHSLVAFMLSACHFLYLSRLIVDQ